MGDMHEKTMVIHGGRVLSADGARFREGVAILVADGRIVAVVDDADPAARDAPVRIDARGRFVIPGLIDSHNHLIGRTVADVDEAFVAWGAIEGVISAANFLRRGVTTVRDVGCRHAAIFPLRRAIRAGVIPGPRPFVAGLNPTGTGSPRSWRNIFVDGPDSVRQAVRKQWGAGADLIKLIVSHSTSPTDWDAAVPLLTDEEIAAAIDEAHAKGMRIGCHCEGYDMARRVVRLGMDVLDHAALLAEDVVAEMAVRGVGYVPTVWAFSADTGLDLDSMDPQERDRFQYWQEQHRVSIRRAHAAGVVIAAGTDSNASVMTGDELIWELQALGRAGLDDVDLLRAATINGAKVLGRDDEIGRIAEGYLADLVLLDDDPLAGPEALQSVTLVMKEGVVYRDDHGVAPAAAFVPADPDVLDDLDTGRWE